MADPTLTEIVEKAGGWQNLIPQDMTVDSGGRQVPAREHPFFKDSKDFVGFAKQAFDAHSEVGRRTRLPGRDAPDAERQTFKQKLYESGVLEAPPTKPEEYGVQRPEKLPEGIEWDDEIAGELAHILHKHGAPKTLVKDLLDLHVKALEGHATTLKTSKEEGMAALRREHGDKFDERMNVAARLARSIFRTPEELQLFESLGLADHPGFLNVLFRLAPLAEQDSSFMREYGRPGGEASGDDVRLEVAKIMSDKTHPMYDGYWRRDPKVMRHVEELYHKAYGDAQVQIG